MEMKDYIENACKTESVIDQANVNTRILHAGMGLVTEAGELMDALKRHTYYGKEMDLVNVKEECGDIMWYLAILFDELGTSFEEVAETNIKKLSARYPDKFDSKRAIERDLETERAILEMND
jgi:NTP pyrophosphatase (non-canonical NTP hydrolase)